MTMMCASYQCGSAAVPPPSISPSAVSPTLPAPGAPAFFPSAVGPLQSKRTVSERVGDRRRRRRRLSIGLGIVQALLGALCILFNAVSLRFYDGVKTRDGNGGEGKGGVPFVGHGFWIGLMFIVTGTLGLAAGKTRTRCTITAFMTMCIISATFTTVILSLGVAGVIATSSRSGAGYSCGGGGGGSEGGSSPYGFNHHYPYYYRPPCYTFHVVVAMEACMAVAGFLEALVAIWGAVICCKSGIRCHSGPSHAMVMPVNYCPNSGQVMYFAHQAPHGLRVFYALLPSQPYSQGTIIAPLSYQTSYSPSSWCRPKQTGVAGTATGTDIPLNGPPPPYPSNPHLHVCQPNDYEQKY